MDSSCKDSESKNYLRSQDEKNEKVGSSDNEAKPKVDISSSIMKADNKSDLSRLEEKMRAIEREDFEEMEDEFNALMRKSKSKQQGEICIAADPKAREKALGFRIISMNMRDAQSGKVLWRQDHFDETAMFTKEMEERIPKTILSCRAVSREIVFSSIEALSVFRLEQRVFFGGQCIEEWFFAFGYVIPGSTNSWQQIIEAAPPDQMLPAESLSGNITIETSFFDGPSFLGKNLVRIFYV